MTTSKPLSTIPTPPTDSIPTRPPLTGYSATSNLPNFLSKLTPKLKDLYQQLQNLQFTKDAKLEALPEGYFLWAIPRIASVSKVADKYVYGHPSGRKYRSVVEFEPHLLFLAKGGAEVGGECECCLCRGWSGRSRIRGGGVLKSQRILRRVDDAEETEGEEEEIEDFSQNQQEEEEEEGREGVEEVEDDEGFEIVFEASECGTSPERTMKNKKRKVVESSEESEFSDADEFPKPTNKKKKKVGQKVENGDELSIDSTTHISANKTGSKKAQTWTFKDLFGDDDEVVESSSPEAAKKKKPSASTRVNGSSSSSSSSKSKQSPLSQPKLSASASRDRENKATPGFFNGIKRPEGWVGIGNRVLPSFKKRSEEDLNSSGNGSTLTGEFGRSGNIEKEKAQVVESPKKPNASAPKPPPPSPSRTSFTKQHAPSLFSASSHHPTNPLPTSSASTSKPHTVPSPPPPPPLFHPQDLVWLKISLSDPSIPSTLTVTRTSPSGVLAGTEETVFDLSFLTEREFVFWPCVVRDVCMEEEGVVRGDRVFMEPDTSLWAPTGDREEKGLVVYQVEILLEPSTKNRMWKIAEPCLIPFSALSIPRELLWLTYDLRTAFHVVSKIEHGVLKAYCASVLASRHVASTCVNLIGKCEILKHPLWKEGRVEFSEQSFRGVQLGSELVCLGDWVRVCGRGGGGGEMCVEVLAVKWREDEQGKVYLVGLVGDLVDVEDDSSLMDFEMGRGWRRWYGIPCVMMPVRRYKKEIVVGEGVDEFEGFQLVTVDAEKVLGKYHPAFGEGVLGGCRLNETAVGKKWRDPNGKGVVVGRAVEDAVGVLERYMKEV
ncbi:hypothetical protein HDV05_002186 [Chytridiales sp. JEL 0842]|nr:hypothetical protein HDV05_002186 [Chytridiales sp. JEL 0842]